MTYALEFPDKYLLWSQLVQGSSERVFVPTPERPRVGARVPVKLSLAGVPMQIVIEGAVIGVRYEGPRFRAGIFVRFAESQIEKCRSFLGLSQAPDCYAQGRKSARLPCSLPLRITDPECERPGIVKNFSDSGLLVIAPTELSIGQRVKGAIELDDRPSITFRADVSWARHDKRLAGFRFVDLSEVEGHRIREAVAWLASRASATGRPTIVVADDEPNVLQFLSKTLSIYGYEVRKATRGQEALDLIRELKPQLVLLDILMPGIDGAAICQVMRADVELADIPVVFLSALETERLHEVADQSGATDYLTKPVSLTDLINVVCTHLKNARAGAI